TAHHRLRPGAARGRRNHGHAGRPGAWHAGLHVSRASRRLYELLTGELPFRGNKRMLLHQVMHDEPRPPRSVNDRIPRDLETICLKAMAKEPGRRYSSAAELAEDLRRYLRGDGIRARPPSAFQRLARWAKRRRGA